ncbi:hypothetical protein AN640_03555 [Candidatus Epulonipiscium fishelsonii]|uniref:Uncharacterized protein n=1 Tax=Candidatus Epulonipiscium fishelsonii TaxID=77094 RepID=A0ACC8XJ43_9FIRM|nr:hypothetical protein AN640_03555 [Epulopiscium sp. SCG-D08WGA-EpuloA1]
MKMLIASLVMAGIGLGMVGTAGVLAAEMELGEQIVTRQDLNISEELPSFKNIDIDASIIETEILEGDKFYIEAAAENLVGEFIYKVKNDTLFIEHEINKIENFLFNLLQKVDENTINLKIYVPKDTYLNNVEIDGGLEDILICGLDIENLNIENGMGDSTIKDVVVNKFEFEGGMGDSTIEDVVVNKFEFEGGMGELVGKDITSYDTTIEMGMDDVELEGDFAGDIRIEAGMGNVSITTTKEYRDYNFKIEGSMGDVYINDRIYEFMENDINENRDGEYVIDIEGSMGDVKIKTN